MNIKTINNLSDKRKTQGTLVQVANLYYKENLSQQKIADRVGVSRSLIAQYLQRARETGVVKIHISDPDNACENLMSSLKKETGIEIDALREEFQKAKSSPEKIPLKIKRLIAMPDYPKKLVEMVGKAGVLS